MTAPDFLTQEGIVFAPSRNGTANTVALQTEELRRFREFAEPCRRGEVGQALKLHCQSLDTMRCLCKFELFGQRSAQQRPIDLFAVG